MSEQRTKPTNANRNAWGRYWSAQGHYWRTEPEIEVARQSFLASRRGVSPDFRLGIYPFANVEPQLTRADIEWLLATHEASGITGPVDWRDEKQSDRRGLDLRGANLRGLDLSHLPLARTRFGMPFSEWEIATPEQREQAAAHLEGVRFFKARLDRAHFIEAHLEGVDLRLAHLESAVLFRTHLEGSDASAAADMRGAFLSSDTDLEAVNLGDKATAVTLAGVHWGEADLAVVPWARLTMLGDEWRARSLRDAKGQRKDSAARLSEFEAAVRANRQLAATLRAQGMSERADAFAYRAQLCERRLLRGQGQVGGYLGLLFLDLLAGHGYKPMRTFLVYLLVIFGFATAFFLMGQSETHELSPLGSLIFSITSFHGRGFFPGGLALDDPITVIAAAQAIIGLIIEVSFIATFTQRFFGK